MKKILVALMLTAFVAASADSDPQIATPRKQPGAEIELYAPEQHDLYDGRFVLTAARLYQVGQLDDPPGWDHMGNDASTVRGVEGSVEIDVDEIGNKGRFIARLAVPEGSLVLEVDRFHEFSPCQDGGVAAFIYEHGDSGCGDANWPKPSSTSPGGATVTQRSTASLSTRTTRCTS